MLIRSRRKNDVRPSEITSRGDYLNRRDFIGQGAALAAVAGLAPTEVMRRADRFARRLRQQQLGPVDYGDDLRNELNAYEDITSYNNFYEFGTDKRDPQRYSDQFEPLPWTVEVTGECNRPGTYDFEEIVRMGSPVEDRIYRLRCVEAWSMVIPWRGVPLQNVIAALEPTGNAKFVAFETVVRPSQMPGQRRSILDWPYVEGLRIDEAANQLTFLATGLYGEDLLPNENGAPLRLVVPWKYGFKSIKSIVRIAFVEEMPPTTWNGFAPNEYGFYSNVNPEVDHPRWSQARERRIGELRRRPTLMFNGYEEEVGHLYAGMDLEKWY